MFFNKKQSVGFFGDHPFLTMMIGALAATGGAVLVYLTRDKLCRMGRDIGNCASACACNCEELMEQLKDDMCGKP